MNKTFLTGLLGLVFLLTQQNIFAQSYNADKAWDQKDYSKALEYFTKHLKDSPQLPVVCNAAKECIDHIYKQIKVFKYLPKILQS